MRVDMIRSMVARGTLIIMAGVAACSPDMGGPPVVGSSAPSVNSQRIIEPLRDAVDDLPFMRAAGCSEVRGLPPIGAVRFEGKDGRWRSYSCPGVGKAAVRAAIGRYHEAKAERAARGTDGPVRAVAATGYFVLTVTSTQWCMQTQTHLEIGGERVFTVTTIVPGSCFWVTFYSVEYFGGEMPEPWEEYCCAGPGGPPDDDPPPPPPPPADSVAEFSFWEIWSNPGDDLAFPPDFSPSAQAADLRVKAFCTGDSLAGGRITEFQNAIMRIRTRHPDCHRVAEVLDSLLARREADIRVHFFDGRSPPYTFGGAAPVQEVGLGHLGGWMTIGHALLDTYNRGNRRMQVDRSGEVLWIGLDDVLVHEARHLDGWRHPPGVQGGDSIVTRCGFGGVS